MNSIPDINADNMPLRIEHAIGEDVLSTGIIYDGDGVRAKKTIYEEIQLKKKIKVREWNTTYYVGKHFEVADGNAVKYIFAGNLRIAKVADSAKHYFHKDHLSSSVAMTDENGTAVETSEYMPFGHERDHTGTDVTDYKFTDQELDTETGLYNYDARLYDPVIGRFISPDTIVPDYYDPQSLNRYSYCINNPLIYIDPTGHFGENGWGGTCPNGATPTTGIQGSDSFFTGAKGIVMGFLDDYGFGFHEYSDKFHDPLVDLMVKAGLPKSLVNIPSLVVTVPLVPGFAIVDIFIDLLSSFKDEPSYSVCSSFQGDEDADYVDNSYSEDESKSDFGEGWE